MRTPVQEWRQGFTAGYKVRPDKHLDLLFTSMWAIGVAAGSSSRWGRRTLLAFDRHSLGVMVVVRTRDRSSSGIDAVGCRLLGTSRKVVRRRPFFGVLDVVAAVESDWRGSHDGQEQDAL